MNKDLAAALQLLAEEINDLKTRIQTLETEQPEKIMNLEDLSIGYESRWHQHHTQYVHACADCRRELRRTAQESLDNSRCADVP